MVVFKLFSVLARLVQYRSYSLCSRWRAAPSQTEWMHKMRLNKIGFLRTIAVLGLFAAGAAAADDKQAIADPERVATPDTASVHRNLALSANIAAAEDAVEAVLAANKLDLDIHLIGRTSEHIADGP